MSRQSAVLAALIAAGLAASSAIAGGRGGGGEMIPVSVNYHPFSIATADRGDGPLFDIVIDVASVEAMLGEDDLFHHVDLNDDGEAAFIDSFIYVFESNPAARGGLGDLVALNDDDDLGEGGGDGSFSSLDSFLRLSIPAGDYVVAVSTFHFSESEARSGMNLVFDGPFTIREDQTDWENFDHGDYRIVAFYDAPIPSRGDAIFVAEDTIRVIPAPVSIGAFGLAGLALRRRCRA
jgi:hypothetical protein